MKILVTGGTGLIGANLVKQLLAKGHGIVALSNPTRPNRNSGILLNFRI